jgi:hypothetical protein
MSPDPAARLALRRALDSPDPGEVVAALSGLGASGDTAVCLDITARLGAEDAEVRWMAVEIGTRLACLDRATLEAISGSDPDVTVRALAAEKLQLLEALWRVARADATVHKYEEHLIRRIADLLHMPHSSFITAKLRASAESGNA